MEKIQNRNIAAVCCAILAAVFYAINVPCSKLLLLHIPPVFMAGLLYIGAGLGVGLMYVFQFKHEKREERLSRADLPYTFGMIALDIAAPIFLMTGIKSESSSAASLLGNFEIAATTIIAFLLFKEKVTPRLCAFAQGDLPANCPYSKFFLLKMTRCQNKT